MKSWLLILKGMGIGAANVIPGVSGGTIALISGVFEQLIESIKAFDIQALQLLLAGKFEAFAKKVNLGFLLLIFSGVAVSILTFARVLEYLFENFPVFVWSYFFGLILASVVIVTKTIKRWSITSMFFLAIGTGIAVSISMLAPATENPAIWYLVLCGIVAVCSMIIPGLSGSFVLVLMGNYQLIMIRAVNDLDMGILLPVVFGAGIGILLFSHFLSWLLKRFHDQTMSALNGFIAGSLLILWPWKTEVYRMTTAGEYILKRSGEKIISGYQWFFPAQMVGSVWVALGLMILGLGTILWIEKIGKKIV